MRLSVSAEMKPSFITKQNQCESFFSVYAQHEDITQNLLMLYNMCHTVCEPQLPDMDVNTPRKTSCSALKKKYYLNRSCMFFKGLLSYILSESENT
jgi:hypothetical protein